jgi:hypothetical protein
MELGCPKKYNVFDSMESQEVNCSIFLKDDMSQFCSAESLDHCRESELLLLDTALGQQQ